MKLTRLKHFKRFRVKRIFGLFLIDPLNFKIHPPDDRLFDIKIGSLIDLDYAHRTFKL